MTAYRDNTTDMDLDLIARDIEDIFAERGIRHPGWLRLHRVISAMLDEFPNNRQAVIEESLVALGLEP